MVKEESINDGGGGLCRDDIPYYALLVKLSSRPVCPVTLAAIGRARRVPSGGARKRRPIAGRVTGRSVHTRKRDPRYNVDAAAAAASARGRDRARACASVACECVCVCV